MFGAIGGEAMGHPALAAILLLSATVARADLEFRDVQAADGGLRVKRELEGGWFQWMTLPLPALLTIQSGINQLRYATLKGIMAAKKKEIRKVTPAAATEAGPRILRVYFPEKGKQTQMIAGSAADAAKELVAKLREEARVLS